MRMFRKFLEYVKPINRQTGINKLNYILNFVNGGLYNKFKLGNIPNTPIFLMMEATTRCNLNCIMCEHRNLTHKNISELSFEEVKKIINKIPYRGSVTIAGIGEPFCNKDFMKIIKFCKEKGLKVVFPSNFTLLNTEKISELVSLGVDEIIVSFDGATKKTYESIRVGANFEKVILNIKELSKIKKEHNKKVPRLIVQFVEQENNVHEIPLLLKLCSKLGVDEVTIAPLVDLKKPPAKEIIKKKKQETKVQKLAKRLRIKLHNVQSAQPLNKCNWPFLGVFITSEGYVLPCCQVTQRGFSRDFLNRNSFGNILKRDFKEIWFSKKYREFREQIKKGKAPLLCKNCHYYIENKK